MSLETVISVAGGWIIGELIVCVCHKVRDARRDAKREQSYKECQSRIAREYLASRENNNERTR